MPRRIGEIAVGLLLVFLASCCQAGIPPEIVQKAKQATALVQVDDGDGIAEGSAFCIDGIGLFLTNTHVVEPLEVGGKLTLILRSGEKDQKIITAHVVSLDKDADLAILKADVPLKLTPLTLSVTRDLIETTPVVAFGYPFGSDLALKPGDYPSITVSTGHITALHKIKGDLRSIQIDASLNHGNSGSPLLNDNSEVIAVVQEGFPGSAISSAILVKDLKTLLTQAQILFTPPSQPLEHLRDPQEFHIQLLTPPTDASAVTVDLLLSADANDHRTFRATSKDGRIFTVNTLLLPVRTLLAPLQLTIRARQLEIVGKVVDRTILVAGEEVPLSKVRRITNGPRTTVLLSDARVLTGVIKGLRSVSVDLNGEQTNLNLSQVDSIDVTPPPLPASIDFHIAAKQGGKLLGDLQGKIDLQNHKGALVRNSPPRGAGNFSPPVEYKGPVVSNPQNGHGYAIISMAAAPSWTEANDAAQALRYLGRRGHLVTITSAAENDFIVGNFGKLLGGRFWLGGYKDTRDPNYNDPASGWRWVTGEPWRYTNWQPNEPNGSRGGAPHSDFLHMVANGQWNDEQNAAQGDSAKGFLVEFDP